MSLPLRRAGCRQQYDSRAREDALAIQLYTFWGEDYGGGGQHGEGAADLFLWDGRVTWETTATERERVGEALHRRRLLL